MPKSASPKVKKYVIPKKRQKGDFPLYKPEFVDLAFDLAASGKTDVEIAKGLGISRGTLIKYVETYPELKDAFLRGKREADELVIKSLFQRATGYSHPDVHISNYQGVITVTELTKYYPPETTACIFWLKNRRRDEWRDQHEVTGADGKDLIPPADPIDTARRLAFLLAGALQNASPGQC